MKKSKILMPLTGIAAIGAVAPVIAMSSCNKNEYKLIAEGTVGNYVGDYNASALLVGSTVCPVIGNETLHGTWSDAPLALHIKFGKTIEKGHVIKASATHQGSKTATGTIFYVDEFDESTPVITGHAGESEIVMKVPEIVSLNTEKLATWKDKETEEFSFTVSYTEYDSDKENAKVVGKQNYTYKLTANNGKHDLPYIAQAALGGRNKITEQTVALTGWTISGIATTLLADKDITVDFLDKEGSIDLKNGTGADERTLTVKTNQEAQKLNKNKVNLEYAAKLDKAFPVTTTPSDFDFKNPTLSALEVVLKLTADKDYYVVGEWYCANSIDPTTGITVAVAA